MNMYLLIFSVLSSLSVPAWGLESNKDINFNGSVNNESYLIVPNLQSRVDSSLLNAGQDRLEEAGLSRDEDGVLLMSNFLLCLWFWIRFFTKSPSPLSYALSDTNDNTLLLGTEENGIFFAYLGREVRVQQQIEPARWYHICLNVKNDNFIVALDGVMVYSANLTSTKIPLNGTLVLGQDQDTLGGNFNPMQTYVGKLYGLNLWTSDFPIYQNITNQCFTRENKEKALLKYEDMNFLSIGNVMEDVDIPCTKSGDQLVYFIWPIEITYDQSVSLCQFLHMTVPKIHDESQLETLTQLVRKASALCFGSLSNAKYAWISNTVAIEKSKESAEVLTFTDPNFQNGSILETDENSVQPVMLVSTGKWKAASKNEQACAICSGEKFTSVYFLRGVCPIKSDTIKFYPRQSENNLHFHGHLDVVIVQLEKSWEINSNSGETIAKLPGNTSPFGRKSWVVERVFLNCAFQSHFSPMKKLPRPENRPLLFSACDSQSYSCSDGTCKPSSVRCSHVRDCSDGSDEANCDYIRVPTGYSQNLSPPQDPLKLSVSLKLDRVSSIDIVKQIARITMEMTIAWKDNRLQYQNVLPGVNDNFVTNASRRIWLPIVQVKNEDRLEGTVPPLESVRLHSSAKPTFDGEENIFDGSEVDISYTLEQSNNINCFFNFHFYPFDTQRCYIKYSFTNTPEKCLELAVVLESASSGRPIDKLPSEYVMSNSRVYKRRGSITYDFWMTRNFQYPLFSIYFPTTLMHFISYGTLWIPVMDFPDRGTMSLTTLLVLIALYSDVLSQLPVTSYLKFLDVWFIFSITFISLIIFVHLFTSNTNEVQKFRFPSSTRWYYSNESVLQKARIFMGIGYFVFLICYWSYLAHALSARNDDEHLPSDEP